MGISAGTATTIDSPPTYPRRAPISHRLVLIAVAVGVILLGVATVRLAAVVSATPTDVWARELPLLLDATLAPDVETQRRALWLSTKIADAGLIRGLQTVCFAGTAGEGASVTRAAADDHGACMARIDQALAAAPSSGELWYFKASALAAEGDFGEAMMNALSNSYRTSPAEGWIASGRVVVGLRLFPALSEDVQKGVLSDLTLVLANPRLSTALVEAYAGDSALRASAAVPLQELPVEQIKRFVRMVRSTVRDR